jgi:hypothetical protein
MLKCGARIASSGIVRLRLTAQTLGRIMAKLNAAARKALPKSDFAGPDRSYPVPDKSHAANAKARASQAVNAGRMSKGTEAKIDAKANAVLGKKGDGSLPSRGERTESQYRAQMRKNGPGGETRHPQSHQEFEDL